jgi:hypothetical protein
MTTSENYGQMTIPELKTRLLVLGVKSVSKQRKGDLLNAILNAEKKASRAEEYRLANAEQDLLPQDADSPGGEYIPEAPSSNAAEAEADAKGAAKALKIQAALMDSGWVYASLVAGEAGRVTATFTRGQEALTVTWDAGVFNYEETAHAIGDRVTKVRNVSAAIKLGTRPVAEAEKDLERVVRNRTFNKAKAAEGGAPKRSKLPFDPGTATEAELASILAGKTIEWTNRITRGTETAQVTDRSSKYFRLVDAPSGRTLQFVSPEGFKACRLDDIVRVGGSLRKRAQKVSE